MKPIHSPLREKSFFRKTSNLLLRRFFDHHGVLKDIRWDGRDEADVQDIYDTYEILAADTKEKIGEDLENLNDVASQRGMPCLVDSAGRWGMDCRDMTAYDLAMILFLDCRDAFNAAHAWWTIDHFQGYSDFRGKNPLQIKDHEKGRAQLEAAFSAYLEGQEKGIHVQVEVYKDVNKLAYVLCHEDYIQRNSSAICNA